MNSEEKFFIIPMCISSNEKSKLSVKTLSDLEKLYFDMKKNEIYAFREMILKNNEFQELKFMCENTILFFHINITKSILYLEHGYTKEYF